MRRPCPRILALACAWLALGITPARGEDAAAAPDARVGIIPRHWSVTFAEVDVPPCWKRVRYPCYDEVRTPIYELRMVERTMTVHVPVAVPVRLMRQVVVPGKPPCGCEPGTRGRILRVPVGITPGVAPAVRAKVVKVGAQPAWVETGETVMRTLRGYGWKTVDVNAGRKRRVPTRTFVPARAVTVVGGGDAGAVAALPGTSEVMTRGAFDAALRRAAENPATE